MKDKNNDKERVDRRPDDYQRRRQRLEGLSDRELLKRFWDLTDQLVRPLTELAFRNTSPSVERSVLLRMGFSSLEAGELVKAIVERGLLGEGAGHVVLRLSEHTGLDVREAGRALLSAGHGGDSEDLWSVVEGLFGKEGAVR